MRYTIVALSILVIAAALTACGKKDQGGGNIAVTTPVYPVVPVAPVNPAIVTPTGIRWSSSIQITDRPKFEQLIEQQGGFCKRDNFWGNNTCEDYSKDAYIRVQMLNASNVEAQITIGAGSSDPYWGIGSVMLPLFRTYVQYVHSASGTGISTGVRFQAKGYMAGPLLPIGLYAESTTGKVTDYTLLLDLYYNNVKFGTATVTRY